MNLERSMVTVPDRPAAAGGSRGQTVTVRNLNAWYGKQKAISDENRRLTEENRSLRHSQEQLATERAQLLARNEQARSRVEAMILRLKSLEQNHG